MADVIQFKPKDDYSHLVFIKTDDDTGEKFEVFGIDEMTEPQFKKFCADTGTKWFQRCGLSISA
jgi:hypothetical protein